MKEGRTPVCPEKTPDCELKKKTHTKLRNFKPKPRLQSIWQSLAMKAHVLIITPSVAPITESRHHHPTYQGTDSVTQGVWLNRLYIHRQVLKTYRV